MRLNGHAVVRALGTLLALVLLVILLRQQGWDEIRQALAGMDWRIVLFAVGLVYLSRMTVGLRWYVLLRGIGERVPLWPCLKITFAGLFASNFLPSTIGGDFIRLAGAHRLKVDRAVLAASLVVDRLVGIATMSVLAPIGLVLLAGSSAQASLLSMHPWIACGAAFASPIQKVWGRVRRITERLLNALLLWWHQPWALLWAAIASFTHMSLVFLAVHALTRGVGEVVSFVHVAGLWSLVYFVTLLPVSLNGFGLQELSLTYIFAIGAGMSMTSSLTIALIIRVLLLAGSLPGAVFLPGLLPDSTAGGGGLAGDDTA